MNFTNVSFPGLNLIFFAVTMVVSVCDTISDCRLPGEHYGLYQNAQNERKNAKNSILRYDGRL